MAQDGFRIDIETDAKQLAENMDAAVVRQLPFAFALASTRMGQRIKRTEYETMQRVFDRPTRWTLNSLMLKPGSKADPNAYVWFRDWAPKGTPAARYLLPQVYGGERSAKRSEVLLRRQGLIGQNQFITPGKRAKLDRYGNISRGQMQKVLSNLRAQFDATQNTAPSGRVTYFAGHAGAKKRFAIYQRDGDAVRPFLAVVKAPTYQKRFDFFGVAEKQMRLHYPIELANALRHAIDTAR